MNVAADEVTYSGDTVKLQIVRQIHVSGSEGSKTLSEFATDDVGGVRYSVVKLDVGGDGVSASLSTSNPVPVSDTATKVDDAPFTQGTDKVLMIGATHIASVSDPIDDGDAGALRMSGSRNLYVQIRDVAEERSAFVTENNALAVADSGANVLLSEVASNTLSTQLYVDSIAQALKLDDAPFTPGNNLVMMVGAQCDATAPDTVNEGDAGAVRMTADRALHSSIRDAEGNNRGANVNANNEVLVKHTDAIPVTGTFFQATQPVSAASLPLPTGAATAAKQPAIGTAGTPSVDVITVQGIASMTAFKVDGSAVTQPVSGTFWQATQPVSGPLTDAQLRAVAVPVSGTFFQATQPVSVATVPSHDVTNAGTFPVQSTETRPSTATLSNVAGNASSVQLLASTAARRGAYFFNDSAAICYLKLGTTASTTSFTIKMAAGSFYELPSPCYTGRIDAIWASADGAMRITEVTA